MKNTTPNAWLMRRRTKGLPLQRNPLCRTSDRVQQVSAWAWCLIAALAIPVIGVFVVPRVADSWHQPMQPVTAVVENVTQNPVAVTPYAELNLHRTYAVQVHWATRSRSVRHGSVTLSRSPRRGSDIRVWVSRRGDHVTSVRPHDIRAMDLAVLTIYEAADICLLGYGAHRLLRWQLDRRRLRDWELELDHVLTPHRPSAGPETAEGV